MFKYVDVHKQVYPRAGQAECVIVCLCVTACRECMFGCGYICE